MDAATAEFQLTLFWALIAFGGLVRLLLLPLWGCQDMEYWKAFAVFAAEHGLKNLYGASDKTVWASWCKTKDLAKTLEETQTVILYRPAKYSRTEYWLPHLPLFLYPLWLVGKIYQRFDSQLPNNRTFNTLLNLIPFFASVGLAAVIYKFAAIVGGQEAAIAATLLYWLNPVVILNSPIQGFMDAPTALLSTAAVFALYLGQLPAAFALLALSVCHKPLGVLAAPVFFAVGLSEFAFPDNFLAWCAGGVAVIVVLLPYIITGRILSVITGLLSTSRTSGYISSLAMNPWWIFQYRENVRRAVAKGINPRVAKLGGPYSNWFGTLFSKEVEAQRGIPLRKIGFAFLVLFTALNLFVLVDKFPTDRPVIIFSAAMQIYAYYMLRLGVQTNHYFNMIPLFALSAGTSSGNLLYFCAVSAIFTAQDWIFFGFGRDRNPGLELLTARNLGWISVMLAVLNSVTFSIGTYLLFTV